MNRGIRLVVVLYATEYTRVLTVRYVRRRLSHRWRPSAHLFLPTLEQQYPNVKSARLAFFARSCRPTMMIRKKS